MYRLHPEPDTGAAIMLVHRFAPQIQCTLFNYSTWAAEPKPMEDLGEVCPCTKQVRDDCPMKDGHVLSTEVEFLRSPYLRDILARGKKFRLEEPVSMILPRLKEGLDGYID